jgi:para-nitrobenzyl esterase
MRSQRASTSASERIDASGAKGEAMTEPTEPHAIHVDRTGHLAGRATRARRLARRVALTVLLVFPLGAASHTAATTERTAVVKTSNGPIRGVLEGGGIHAFKGVRYGAPPVGALRFLPPRRAQPWTEVADAAALGAQAMQSAEETGATAYGPGQSEDCLFLNVWTPGLDNRRRPVMVWIHGGAWSYGSGGLPIYDGGNLARRGDVTVVTVNHRLNAFGYTHLGDLLGPAYAQSGVAGLLDLVLALEWVRDNIAAFGGDPRNVTLFGESGGGLKISHLLAMPPARGLFHKAIIQSGPGLRAVSPESGTALARALLDALGAKTADSDAAAAVKALSSVDALELFRASQRAEAAAGGRAGVAAETRARFAPVRGNDALPGDPWTPEAPALSADVPILIGTNKDEGTFFLQRDPKFGKWSDEDFVARVRENHGDRAEALIAALRAAFPSYSPTHLITAERTVAGAWLGSLTLAERKLAQRAAPVYMYLLRWESPVNDGMMRAAHAIDLPLVFDTVAAGASLVGSGPEPQILADQMSAAWIAFARHGDPNAPGLPRWPVFDTARRATMVLDTESRVEEDPYAEIRRILRGAGSGERDADRPSPASSGTGAGRPSGEGGELGRTVEVGETGFAARRPVLASACPYGCPWGELGELVQEAMQPLGYEVVLCRNCNLGNGPRIVANASRPPALDALQLRIGTTVRVNAPVDFGITAPAILASAWEGSGAYAEDGPYRNLRLIARIEDPRLLLVAVKADSAITDLAQVAERRLPVRILSRGGERVLEHYGLTSEAVESWGGSIGRPSGLDYTLDFDVLIGTNASPANNPESSFWPAYSYLHDLRFLDLPEALLDELVAEDGELERVVARWGFLRGVDRAIATVGSSGQVVFARADTPEPAAYDVAKAIDERRAGLRWLIRPYSYDPSTVWRTRSAPLHPGAERYYREKGYLR